jgi:hypothetical protein
VSVASESGVNIPAETVHYGVTEAAQLALLRGLAETTAGMGGDDLPRPVDQKDLDALLRQRMLLEAGRRPATPVRRPA